MEYLTEQFTLALSAVFAAFAMPATGLSAIFIWCTASATLLPLGSEPIVFAYIRLHPEQFALCIAVATVGNTLGGMINYGLAYGAKHRLKTDGQTPRVLAWFEMLGPKMLFFSFLPIVGDPLTAAAGWLKMPWLPCLLWQAAGKALRYISSTVLLLWVPDAWWANALMSLKSFFM
jgi:membrane protein YqaA with SNARE-associated domain